MEKEKSKKKQSKKKRTIPAEPEIFIPTERLIERARLAQFSDSSQPISIERTQQHCDLIALLANRLDDYFRRSRRHRMVMRLLESAVDVDREERRNRKS